MTIVKFLSIFFILQNALIHSYLAAGTTLVSETETTFDILIFEDGNKFEEQKQQQQQSFLMFRF